MIIAPDKTKSRIGGKRSGGRLRGRMRYLERNRRITAAFKAGDSIAKLAGKFDLTETMIRYVLRQMGVKMMRGTGPTFPCGHPRSKKNTRKSGNSKRCLECHLAANRRWHKPKNPLKALYAPRACALENTWR